VQFSASNLTLYLQLLQVHRNGVDLTSVDRNGLTALHHAAALGNKRIVKYLLEQGNQNFNHLYGRNSSAILCSAAEACDCFLLLRAVMNDFINFIEF
jgi:ankyrin repeat protein